VPMDTAERASEVAGYDGAAPSPEGARSIW